MEKLKVGKVCRGDKIQGGVFWDFYNPPLRTLEMGALSSRLSFVYVVNEKRTYYHFDGAARLRSLKIPRGVYTEQSECVRNDKHSMVT
jgi:hypothetical protein